jgi:PKD repeat protein
VILNGSNSTDDGQIVSYAWKQLHVTAKTKVKLATANKATASFTSLKTAGALQFQLTVTDNDKIKSIDTVNVNVSDVNSAQPLNASLDVSSTSIIQGESVTASASAITGGTGPYTVKFDWGDASTPEVNSLANGVTQKSSDHVYADVGTYSLVITVTDSNSSVKTDTFTITSNSNIPDLAGTLTLTAASATFNTAVEAKADITGGVAPYTVVYDWGDGKTNTYNLAADETTKTATHFYELVGTYTVKITITDNNGTSKSYTQSATVKAKAIDPLTPCTS